MHTHQSHLLDSRAAGAGLLRLTKKHRPKISAKRPPVYPMTTRFVDPTTLKVKVAK